MAQSQTALDTFQATTATTLSEFSGKFEALAVAIGALSVTGVNISPEDIATVTKTLDDHGRLLKECLKFCTSALNAATETTPATKVKYAKAVANARSIRECR